jgi:hypothetical protein
LQDYFADDGTETCSLLQPVILRALGKRDGDLSLSADDLENRRRQRRPSAGNEVRPRHERKAGIGQRPGQRQTATRHSFQPPFTPSNPGRNPICSRTFRTTDWLPPFAVSMPATKFCPTNWPGGSRNASSVRS